MSDNEELFLDDGDEGEEGMTLEDLRISLQNFMPTWCEIEEDENGEIIIRTGMKEVDGRLVDMDE